MKNLSHTLSCIKKDVYISFVISFVCLVVILLILCAIPLWGSATVHSHSGKELNPFSKENAHFSGRCTSTKLISLYPPLFLFGTQQQLTHPPVKGSSFRLRKTSVLQGVAPRHTIFTSYCVIPLWDSATAHSTSSKEFNPSSQKNAQGAVPWHTIFISSCAIPLWNSAAAHSPSGKELNPFSLE